MEDLSLLEHLEKFRTTISYHHFDHNYIVDLGVNSYNKLLKEDDLKKILQTLSTDFNDSHSLRENVAFAIEDHLKSKCHA